MINMSKLAFRHTLHVGLMFITLAMASSAQAQLQFIPSIWLREWMNELAPGCVDAAGYLDPDHPALDTVHTAVCNTNTLDLTGIQYLHHLKDLTIYCAGAGVITPVLPDSLERLTLGGFGFTDPISIPEGLSSLVAYWSGEIVGAIPSTLDTLLVHSFNTSMDVLLMPLPDGLTYLELVTSAQVTGLTSFPATLRHLRLVVGAPICLPTLPMEMDHMELGPTTTFCLPNLPTIQDPDDLIIPSTLQFCDPFAECIYSNAIGGSIWHDANGDGIRGPDEGPFPGDAVRINSSSIVGVTNEGYWIRAATEGDYAVTTQPISPHAVAQTPVAQTATLSATQPVVILPGFSYQLIPDITDVVMDITTTPLIAGRTSLIHMTLRNIGSLMASGSATVIVPSGLTIAEIIPDPIAINGQTVTWALDELQVGEQRTWTIAATIPALPPGSWLSFIGHAATSLPDIDPANNSSTWPEQVLASFDPNDKLVFPNAALAAEVTTGTDLHYTIRFQNTGNHPASRVVITDTLSSDLIASSMQYVSSSHPCSWSLSDGVLAFRFDPIYLPDSTTDLSGSQGFVKFSIATQPALPSGQLIHNAASIFFDINPPIHTEPCVFEVMDDATGMTDAPPTGAIIGPNPASELLLVHLNGSWGSPVQVTITDMLGKRIAVAAEQSRTEIGIAGLAAGLLHVSVSNGQHHEAVKVIKL